jgi:hypothetical protein
MPWARAGYVIAYCARLRIWQFSAENSVEFDRKPAETISNTETEYEGF